MKALTRVPIFSYSTLSTTLLIPTKSIEIKFRKSFLTEETLTDLESILNWCKTHTEVQSILFTSFGQDFVQGLDPSLLKSLSVENLKNLVEKTSHIAQTFFSLPQTIVVDMKKGTRGIGLEIALAADIRLAKNDAVFCFNHLSLGLTPACGPFSFLKPYLNQNILRSLLLSGAEFNLDGLKALGGWCESELDPLILLGNIFAQAPIARLQAKRGLYGIDLVLHQENLAIEKQIFNAVIHSMDYTKENDFMNLSEFKEKVAEVRN